MQSHDAVPVNPFASSRENFEALLSSLSTDSALAKDHADLERTLKRDGFELLRQLLQDHLDLRGLREEALPGLLGSDEVLRTHRRDSNRLLETIFGTVTVSRLAYGTAGRQSLHPMDATLNLPRESFSFGVRRHVAEAVAQGAYDGAVESVLSYSGAHLAKRQAEALARRTAVDFDTFYTRRAATVPMGSRESILVITIDGKGIVMRPEDLREATKKAAAKATRKLKHRLTTGEKANRKRMATVAAVYAIGRFVRTAKDIMDDLRREKKAEKRPRPHDKRVWASVEKDPEAVIREAFNEAECRDRNRKKTWVVLVDGNATQLEIVQRVARESGRAVVIVLDFIHAVEYLWKAGHALFKPGTPELEAWVTERMTMLLDGKVNGVARGMRRSATCRQLDADQREAIDRCAGYLIKHGAFMRYEQYLATGLPIASGVIEGACRHLIKDRMDITGARWSLAGAEAVLRLRALACCGDFDDYWRFHEAQEAQRNHAAFFAVPVMRTTAGAQAELAS
jgi:hypothetical protein